MKNKKTIVKGLRASEDFFNRCDLVAKCEKIDRNKLIIRVVEEYINRMIDLYCDLGDKVENE